MAILQGLITRTTIIIIRIIKKIVIILEIDIIKIICKIHKDSKVSKDSIRIGCKVKDLQGITIRKAPHIVRTTNNNTRHKISSHVQNNNKIPSKNFSNQANTNNINLKDFNPNSSINKTNHLINKNKTISDKISSSKISTKLKGLQSRSNILIMGKIRIINNKDLLYKGIIVVEVVGVVVVIEGGEDNLEGTIGMRLLTTE